MPPTPTGVGIIVTLDFGQELYEDKLFQAVVLAEENAIETLSAIRALQSTMHYLKTKLKWFRKQYMRPVVPSNDRKAIELPMGQLRVMISALWREINANTVRYATEVARAKVRRKHYAFFRSVEYGSDIEQ